MAERRGELSDGEILSRLDSISGDIHEIRREMTIWRSEFVAQEVYRADQRTAAEIRRQIDKDVADIATEVVDLKAEATRKARERRTMWTAITAALAAAVVSGVFGLAHSSPQVNVCVPTATQAC